MTARQHLPDLGFRGLRLRVVRPDRPCERAHWLVTRRGGGRAPITAHWAAGRYERLQPRMVNPANIVILLLTGMKVIIGQRELALVDHSTGASASAQARARARARCPRGRRAAWCMV